MIYHRIVEMYKSQIGQDRWVHSVVGDKQNGFFIELGASDGDYLSNTYFFEKGKLAGPLVCKIGDYKKVAN